MLIHAKLGFSSLEDTGLVIVSTKFLCTRCTKESLILCLPDWPSYHGFYHTTPTCAPWTFFTSWTSQLGSVQEVSHIWVAPAITKSSCHVGGSNNIYLKKQKHFWCSRCLKLQQRMTSLTAIFFIALCYMWESKLLYCHCTKRLLPVINGNRINHPVKIIIYCMLWKKYD